MAGNPTGKDEMPAGSIAPVAKIVVQVMLLSGEPAWGPEEVNVSTKVEKIIQEVSEHVGQPAIAISLLHEGKLLEPGSSLGSLVLADGTITLQSSIGAILAEAQHIFDRFLVFFSALNAEGVAPAILESPNALPRSDIDATLKEISAAAGIDSLPADAAVWLQVLLCTGKDLNDYRDDFTFSVADFVGHVDEDGTFGGFEICDGGGVAKGGLVYLSVFGDNDNVLYWIIDAGGELAKMNGQDGVGAVYFAETWDDVWEADGTEVLTSAFWQDVKDNGGHHPNIHIVMQPTRVAESVTALFEAWMAKGGVPGGRRGK